ncbi:MULTISPECIES: hypothetical protein [unclassified Corallococcus]|uniref:hypothetical protein n=1 Tax=unclassified Corallococcus TaxID=2685029 RepID=UPI001A8D77A3|nr:MULTISPECIES: hypothetical protein [unclassified Corallococcus]MBN9687136.1 hypothetical protein [Corallococcus sp. NCSPR001]WAS89037.1 hypothetical protein O0N60_19140 [Corallococcus sp. NCRR]
MPPVSTESAVLILAVSQLLVPLLNGLLSRRQTKHESAVDQVPLLVQSLGAVAQDVRDIKTELRVVNEHSAMLKVFELRLRALEDWMGAARPQLHQVVNHVTLLMGERTSCQLQHAANVVNPKDVGSSRP